MAVRNPSQLATRRRIEAGIRLVAPFLDLVLGGRRPRLARGRARRDRARPAPALPAPGRALLGADRPPGYDLAPRGRGGHHEEQLAWEARQRRGAAIAAGLAALCTFVGTIWRFRRSPAPPRVGFLDALDERRRPGPLGGGAVAARRALRVLQRQRAHRPAVELSCRRSATWRSAGAHLPRRRDALPPARVPEGAGLPADRRRGAPGALDGPGDARDRHASDFLGGPKTVDAAHDIGAGGLTVFAQILSSGTLALALALVLIALNAMRVGLLTRFVGIIGIFSGVAAGPPARPRCRSSSRSGCCCSACSSSALARRRPAGLADRAGRAVAELRRHPRPAPEGGRRAAGRPVEPEPEPVGAGRARRRPRRRPPPQSASASAPEAGSDRPGG